MKYTIHQLLNALIHLFLMVAAGANFMSYFPIPDPQKDNYILGSIWFWFVMGLCYIGYVLTRNSLLRHETKRHELIVKSLEAQTTPDRVLESIRTMNDAHFQRVKTV